jgi:hypothetical protein
LGRGGAITADGLVWHPAKRINVNGQNKYFILYFLVLFII